MGHFPAGLSNLVPSVSSIYLGSAGAEGAQQWYALYTLPQNEKSVTTHLALREIESYLPTYPTVRRWKNRQQVRLDLPLFPSYLFVRVGRMERGGFSAVRESCEWWATVEGQFPFPDATIEFLRSDLCSGKAEPYRELVVGRAGADQRWLHARRGRHPDPEERQAALYPKCGNDPALCCS